MVLSFTPASALLRKYIYSFNTFRPGADLNVNYLAFPQTGSTLFFLNKARTMSSDQQLHILPDENAQPSVQLLGKYTVPILLSYGGYVDELSIDFTPLGINYFFERAYGQLAPQYFQELKQEQWIGIAQALYALPDVDSRQSRLEAFLEGEYRDRQLNSLQQAVAAFMDPEAEVSAQQAGSLAGLTQKTLLRNFKKYAGCTPQKFMRIVRFRQSLSRRYTGQGSSNLTQLGLASQFYDSSHFGREYRLLTGRCPKEFFRNISFIGDNRYPYLFS